MANKNQPNDILTTLKAPWESNDHVVWLASTIRLHRSIEKFKFPQKLDTERKEYLCSLAFKDFLDIPGLSNPAILRAEEMSPMQKEFLIEHFLITESLHEANRGAGFGIDTTGEVIALFNSREHLQLQVTDCIGDLEKNWNRLMQIEEAMQKNNSFAFSRKFGFLTSDPTHCGTGLIISAYLHVPALIHTGGLLDCVEREKSEGIIASGLQGNPDELIGDILMVKNLYTLGVSEETIISSIRNAILHIVIAEKGARSQIKQQKKDSLKDAVSKAIGLLKFSFKLEASEALSAISMLKLGIEMGWISGMSVKEVNHLFFDCRRAHLSYLLGTSSPTEEIATKRADYLRRVTEAVTLDFLPKS
ncbi:MAG: protein arginine kinase [Verrucomicrobia bacterium]|nr:protein arginine kinase [Verrucomicrobiota bacterium]